jgi:hypothetical protein
MRVVPEEYKLPNVTEWIASLSAQLLTSHKPLKISVRAKYRAG